MLLGDGTRMADSTTMLSISDPIHMVLIKTDIFAETTLVASYFLEWRSVLGSENGVTSLTVELMGVGMTINITATFFFLTFIYLFIFYFTLQYCIGFAIH